ncbi:uncharacterized protein PFL1_05104 [Pseudozyma flocculosa PF-1]|uniref:Related to TRS31 - TRAPP subunit of 31 kDa involved in targeting and fusion of ER to golgi transport vesicles n=2 Tax=Pseudozyma flocculosa TaxID=84751 RepID=A0A5C3F4W5_9BASI|nr:uncharacterized protein PFL1_05104 [Pseudozyma flocculosa PF-1]EPQ27181.1 hypothetical protein PFL1_05104 [Pseudozyma flocculosa PF-1]SPO39543.1 related to TRS31 - TRAPP subunit of 31 kDa involved in targeting and fusion of ER to golgi transport vesicles [Pseudozyma flocculosa]
MSMHTQRPPPQRLSNPTGPSASTAAGSMTTTTAAPGSGSSYSFTSPRTSLPPPFSSRRTSQTSSYTPHRASSTGGGGGGGRISLLSSSSSDLYHHGNNDSTTTTTTTTGVVAGGPDILDRPRDKTRLAEVALASLHFLVAEAVAYTQARVNGISDLEKRLSLLGYHVGQRLLPLTLHRQETSNNPKNPKRETRLLPTLLWIHGAFWKALFGRQADSLERSTEAGRSDEYMISTNVPTFSRAISIPKEMSQLSVEAITAGIVEAALDGLGFPARVTAHSVPTPEFPARTTILIKLDRSVMEREEALGS